MVVSRFDGKMPRDLGNGNGIKVKEIDSLNPIVIRANVNRQTTDGIKPILLGEWQRRKSQITTEPLRKD
ncbi:hypothetical protein KKF81_00475 [Candidatus Micrarchaeota archaeon]|nr:hypothetical protein [Candidatus Micrarchaeota archaeon]MBU1165393.1 hypothetical protein [Candidatus Micrarchaeota archaeon]MBU1886208.1 hypothetical protein [Candidatus Micrarchaeota archaeon]